MRGPGVGADEDELTVLARRAIADQCIYGVDRDAMVAVLEKLHDTQAWKDALVKNGWSDAFMTGPAFENFLTEQDHRVETTLTELGLV